MCVKQSFKNHNLLSKLSYRFQIQTTVCHNCKNLKVDFNLFSVYKTFSTQKRQKDKKNKRTRCAEGNKEKLVLLKNLFLRLLS